MEMMRSSIIGREFVNYRKNTVTSDRERFSHKVRAEGVGNIPIVVDSVDWELSVAIGIQSHPPYRRVQSRYGREFVKHMDQPLSSVLWDIKVILIQRGKENLATNLVLGLEDGTIPHQGTELGKLYNVNRNVNDKILYLLLSKERSVYGYIMSILKYLRDGVWNVVIGRRYYPTW